MSDEAKLKFSTSGENVLKLTPEMSISQPEYVCPVHGDIGPNIIVSSIKEHEGEWCQVCYVEWMERTLKRVTPKKATGSK